MFPPDFHEAFTSFSSVVKKYKKILGYGLFAQTGVILNFFNLRLDFYFINYFKGVKELGLYSIATAVGESLYLIPYAIGRMWFPRVAKNQAGKKEKTFQILLVTFIISSLTGIILIATGKLLLTFMFGEKFEGSYIPLIILIPGIISLGLSSVIASYFHGIGKPQWGTLMSVISISFTIILDFLLIPVYGIKGAAIASSIAYTISFLTGFFTIFRV
jgi:O-antigen/teichoic acid export membrane protein